MKCDHSLQKVVRSHPGSLVVKTREKKEHVFSFVYARLYAAVGVACYLEIAISSNPVES